MPHTPCFIPLLCESPLPHCTAWVITVRLNWNRRDGGMWLWFRGRNLNLLEGVRKGCSEEATCILNANGVSIRSEWRKVYSRKWGEKSHGQECKQITTWNAGDSQELGELGWPEPRKGREGAGELGGLELVCCHLALFCILSLKGLQPPPQLPPCHTQTHTHFICDFLICFDVKKNLTLPTPLISKRWWVKMQWKDSYAQLKTFNVR